MKANKSHTARSGRLPGSLIIFENPVSVYAYAPSLAMYRIVDERFFDISLYFDLKTFMEVFNKNFEKALASRKHILSVPYNPILAKVVTVCLKKYFSKVIDLWKLVTFFHDDETTSKYIRSGGDDALDYKCFLLLDMLNYPSIQKYEIPYNVLIAHDYLSTFFA